MEKAGLWSNEAHSNLFSQPRRLSFSILLSLQGYSDPRFNILRSKDDLRSRASRFKYFFSCNIEFSYLYPVGTRGNLLQRKEPFIF